MVHGFAEQSGGAFVLHSQKGRGTTAEIWLPVAKDSTQTGTLRLAQSGPVQTQRSRTILAVDDERSCSHEHGRHARRSWSFCF